jgi:hypothetical protein
MFKAIFASVAVSVAAASTLVAAPAHAMECDRFPQGMACTQRVSSSIDRLGLKMNNGATFIGEITCTGTRWILHDGWTGNFTQAQAATAAEAYCEGRGSMFTGA